MGKVSIIAAAGRDMSIGRQGNMPWHLHEDLQHFKQLTTGHSVIMGRRTWESLPRRPLPGRQNIVITSNTAYEATGAIISPSIQKALEMCSEEDSPFIIGGGLIYRQALPLCHRIYLTLIDIDTPDADTFFPLINPDRWVLADQQGPFISKNGLGYKFLEYESRNNQ